MASVLRYAVASPKKQYFTGEYTLDLAYITPNLIVCSMPTSSCIKGWYRMWLADLLSFLKQKHGSNWRLFNFQAEKSGYGDQEVYGKVSHYPFLDHNPPPFELFPEVISELKKFLSLDTRNVALLHCKAGKGRSGTVACAFLMSNYKYSFEKATALFTEHRMRSSFGEGISIASQRRYLRYVEDWVHVLDQQYYCPIKIRIDQVRIWQPYYPELDVTVCEYTEKGANLAPVYTFTDSDVAKRLPEYVILAPENPDALIAGADVRFSFQHKYLIGGTFPVLHSTAYTWFNAFFETYGSSEGFDFCATEGCVSFLWNDLDGFKGTSKRGSPLFDRIDIFWTVVEGVPTSGPSRHAPPMVLAPVVNPATCTTTTITTQTQTC